MTLRRLLIGAAVLLLLFMLVSQPEQSATWVKELIGGIIYVFKAIITFVSTLIHDLFG